MSGLTVQVREVCKTYHLGAKAIPVLTGVALDVGAGERLAIVGPSGSGKSTLLHLIGTLDQPDSGEIVLGGKSVIGEGSTVLAELRSQSIGFVFQFHHLLPEFTAVENVMMPALIARRPRPAAKDRAQALLSELGLAHRFEHKPGEMSGGEQQRVALARALMGDPGLLLADEVTGNLDRDTAASIHDLLVRINEERKLTLIVVTHNLELAEMMGRTQRLVQGRLAETGRAA